MPRASDTLDRATFLERLSWVQSANIQVLGPGHEANEMLQDYEQSVAFAHRAFDEFETHKVADEHYDWSFIVPARGQHASEVTNFLPILDAKYGMSPEQMHRTVAHLAPTKIETYQGNGDTRGMILYTPAFFDTSAQMTSVELVREAIPAAKRRVDEAAHLARRRYKVGLAGLGAVLPKVTNLGKSIRERGLETTTGHAGTVHLISELVERVVARYDDAPTVGMLGLGSIGASALDVLQHSPITSGIRQFGLYDTQDGLVQNILRAESQSVLAGVHSERELLETSDVIVAAVTRTIDLDEYERRDRRPIDLTGKVIIDDSQPGCFSREQVEARGGVLVWVVGDDQSASQFLHREAGYRYGNSTGLYGAGASWGCEAEVGALAVTSRPELAVKGSVTPEIAREIGRICFDAGIRAAWPPQSFGRPVEF